MPIQSSALDFDSKNITAYGLQIAAKHGKIRNPCATRIGVLNEQIFYDLTILTSMCGRFRVARKKEILEEEFGAEFEALDAEWTPRYNAAPGQAIAVLRQDASQPIRYLKSQRWGLIPSWANDASVGYKMINARSETVSTQPSFRVPFRSRRCLIPADGFYEWKHEGGKKLPFCFTMADDSMFAFAGLWDEWRRPEGATLESCTILTTTPNELVGAVHNRMPVILPREVYDVWLDPGFKDVDELKSLLKPYPAYAMKSFRVSERVNNVKNDDVDCIAPV